MRRTEHGILFAAPMVRAILDGTKRQTRRVLKLREFGPSTTKGYDWSFRDRRACWNDYRADRIAEVSPHGKPGDGLWVRETWQRVDDRVIFRADVRDPIARIVGVGAQSWRSPIHLARKDARIVLEILSVRPERLDAITEEDAKAEGVTPSKNGSYRSAFEALWEEINGERAPWSGNPWLWVIGFRVRGAT